MPTRSLTNQYVKKFYDKRVRELGDYTHHRWFSSPSAINDYKETERTLRKALKTGIGEALEIGPGGGIWTELLTSYASSIHLIDQSEEMLLQAKKCLERFSNITMELSDFVQSEISRQYDSVISIRAFEYFDDHKKAIQKIHSSLKSGGRVILVTKNPEYISWNKGEDPDVIHSGRIGRKQMVALLQESGFAIEAVYPAVIKWKLRYFISRLLSRFFHELLLIFGGMNSLPFLSYFVESYLYLARKP
ncbi:MAG: ubiquinone/menaquinone biosynthesis methyltransferase [Parcubacteria group bacterium Gr01-1014_29]|nr:MAG: ubiquinone/menaquinone biosynthesis methyltransferase [Parcubacteria group bacterium Gr01-1014_29]